MKGRFFLESCSYACNSNNLRNMSVLPTVAVDGSATQGLDTDMSAQESAQPPIRLSTLSSESWIFACDTQIWL